MVQQVQELIEKIKNEGIQTAQVKAQEIEKNAQNNAEHIINDAKKQAQEIVEKAQEEAEKIKSTTEVSLQQVARNMLLDLRRQIEEKLQKIVKSEVDTTLTEENLARLIEIIVKNNEAEETVKVALNAKDREQLEKGFMAKLKDQLKTGISFETADTIGKGFTISFDGGKSSFDFTDESLVEYLTKYLNDRVSQVLNTSIKSK